MTGRLLQTEFGTQDTQTLSQYSTTTEMSLNAEHIPVSHSGDYHTTGVPSHLKNTPGGFLYARLIEKMALVKEIYVFHSTSSQNTKELKLLAEQAERIMYGITYDYQERPDTWPGPTNVAYEVVAFVNFLTQLGDIIQKMQNQGRILGAITVCSTANKIKALKEAMVFHFFHLKMRSRLALEHTLGEIMNRQHQLQRMISNPTGSCPNSVNVSMSFTNAFMVHGADVVDNQRLLGTPCNQGIFLEASESEQNQDTVWGLDGQTLSETGEQEMKERQGLVDEKSERLRNLEEGRHSVQEQMAKLNIELEEIKRLWSFPEHPPSEEQEKEAASMRF